MTTLDTATPARTMPSRRTMLLGSLAAALPLPNLAGTALAEESSSGTSPTAALPAPRQLPARLLPVPDTISAELQAVVSAPYPPGWNEVPADAAGWRALQAASATGADAVLDQIVEQLGITVEPGTIAGVPVFTITPNDMPEANRDRLLMHLHGGGYVLYPGRVGAGEGMMMAGYGRFRVVSVDYRMAPDFPFPAPLDDAMAVWQALTADRDPRTMGVFGTSAGGGLTLALMLRLRDAGMALPAAIATGSPWTDLTPAGDSVEANAYVDNVLVSETGWAGAAAILYAGTHDIKDPLISPIYGDFTGLPPTILTSGTRDLLLSDTVRAHRKLRRAGIEAVLQVYEAQSHAQFLTPFVPETEEAFGEITRFLDMHLA